MTNKRNIRKRFNLMLFAALMLAFCLPLSSCGGEEAEYKPVEVSEAEATPEPTPEEPEPTRTPAPTSPPPSSPEPTPTPTPEPIMTPTPEPEPTPEPPPIMPEEPAGDLATARKSWYYNSNNEHRQPGAQSEINLADYEAYYLGNSDEKVIYLTFDEGYENGYTPQILDVLNEKGVKAAFFLTRSYIKNNPELIKRMVDEGHLAGNHSSTHPDFTTLTDEEILAEINDTADYFKEVTGADMPKYLRPPEGVYSEHSLALTQSAGYKTIFWSFAYRDWEVDNQPGKDEAYRIILERYHNGCIMLLHAVSESNTQALPDVIDALTAEGYSFKSLEELGG